MFVRKILGATKEQSDTSITKSFIEAWYYNKFDVKRVFFFFLKA